MTSGKNYVILESRKAFSFGAFAKKTLSQGFLPEGRMSRATISEVAAAAGVAISTASKALNGTGAISPDTVKRIEDAAHRLGYRPNRAAQLLAGKNKSIGIILPENPVEVMKPMIDGLTETLDEYGDYGFRYRMRTFDYLVNGVEGFSDSLGDLKDQINGLIFIPVIDMDACRKLVSQLKIPKVALQSTLDPAICPSVTVDERMVGRMAAEFLSLYGNVRKVAMIAGNRQTDIHRKNFEGFDEGTRARGMEFLEAVDSFDSIENAKDLTLGLCGKYPELDGIFVSSYVSPGVCAALEELGLAGKVRVVGVDVYDRTAKCLENGSLSAIIYQNQRRQARRAVIELLAGMREGKARSVRIKPELVLQSNLSFYI